MKPIFFDPGSPEDLATILRRIAVGLVRLSSYRAAATPAVLGPIKLAISTLDEARAGLGLPHSGEAWRFLQFCVSEDQFENCVLALSRAGQLAKKDFDPAVPANGGGHLLDLICTDFLGTNDFTVEGLQQTLKYFGKLQALTGLRLIVVDRTGKFVAGEDTLELLVSAYEKRPL